MYNFDVIIDRTTTNSVKWDSQALPEDCRDAFPLWIADMDFACSPDIVAAIQERAAHPIYGYTNRSELYYQSFITWMKRRNGWEIKKSGLSFLRAWCLPSTSQCSPILSLGIKSLYNRPSIIHFVQRYSTTVAN